MDHSNKIWTVGHSTRSIETFVFLLKQCQISTLADIRTFPGSKKYPHFNKEILRISLADAGIQYEHISELGGRRKPQHDSVNTAWRHPSFRGYADHMQTSEFKMGIEKLTAMATIGPVAYMCSELVWWKCHRSLVSDFLKAAGWNVYHILGEEKIQEHPFTSPAREVQGKLFYK